MIAPVHVGKCPPRPQPSEACASFDIEKVLDQTNPKDLLGLAGRTFASGATRNSDAGKLDYEGFEHPLVRLRYARYMDSHRRMEDGTLRASDNWTKGMPRRQLLKSLDRHFMDVLLIMRGHPDKAVDPDLEKALCAMLFNTNALLLEVLLGREVPE